MLAQEIIRTKREGGALDAAQIDAFVHGLVDRSWSDSQVAALAMAICLRGMGRDECAALTRAMTHSGTVLNWSQARLSGPVLDKHSTGGVGDKVSLVLAPLLAACGAVVPMISGRGLGHTGGTLDKLESLAGYTLTPSRGTLLRVLREAGCAIVGASARIAPADRRLYAIRDVTATVESLPLITASILSKKLAAGLNALVMDVKVGNGAFCATLPEAQALAESLVDVAGAAGLPTHALITDMNQVLGRTVGNALEVHESLRFLSGAEREPRLLALTLALAAQGLCLAGLAATPGIAEAMARRALDSGDAAERFARMVAGLGGPHDVFAWHVPAAPVVRALTAAHDGVLRSMHTRDIGLAVLALGGGRAQPGDAIDPRVGVSQVLPVGSHVQRGDALLKVHAADEPSADAALRTLAAALQVDASAVDVQATAVVQSVVK